MISTIVATQKFDAVHPILWVSAAEFFVNRLRNMKDLETFIDEVSAIIDKQTLLELYQTATSEPYSFQHVRADGKGQERDVLPEF